MISLPHVPAGTRLKPTPAAGTGIKHIILVTMKDGGQLCQGKSAASFSPPCPGEPGIAAFFRRSAAVFSLSVFRRTGRINILFSRRKNGGKFFRTFPLPLSSMDTKKFHFSLFSKLSSPPALCVRPSPDKKKDRPSSRKSGLSAVTQRKNYSRPILLAML